MRWLLAMFLAPAWGALVVTLYLSYQAWFNPQPESNYMPILAEMVFFIGGYFAYGAVNLATFLFTWLLATLSTKFYTGIPYAVVVGLTCAYFAKVSQLLSKHIEFFDTEMTAVVTLPTAIVVYAAFLYLYLQRFRSRKKVTLQESQNGK